MTIDGTILEGNYMFAGLGPDILQGVSGLGEVIEAEAGRVLFRKGDPGDALFGVLSGEVEISVAKGNGEVDVLNRLGPGAVFGEIALLDDLPRTADAVMARPGKLFTIGRERFMAFVASEPRLVRHLFKLLCERVRWTSETIEQRSAVELELRKLTEAVEHSPSVVIITDPAGIIEYVNPKFTAVTGYLPEEAIGRRPNILSSGKTPEAVYKNLWDTILSGEEWRGELLNRRKDGELYWENTSISPVYDFAGKLKNFVAVKEDITERKRLQDELHRLATTDPLTGVANRRHFMDAGAREVARARRGGQALSVLMMDIDFFKRINDTYGHAVGDETLKAYARTVSAGLRESDLVGRLGGEEFAVLLPGSDRESAIEAAERLRTALAAVELATEKGPLRFTVSIGVAQCTAADENVEQLLNRADAALYEAKHGGRNRVVAG